MNRYYTKKELALMYFPSSQPHTAVNHLMAWINRCKPLADGLATAGYDKKAKSFTPRQTSLIIEHLGDP